MTLQAIVAEFQIDDLVTAFAEPVFVERHLALAGRVHHSTWDDEFPYPFLASDEDLVGGEDHVFQVRDWVDRFNFALTLL